MDKRRGNGYFAVAQVLTLEQNYVEADEWYQVAVDLSQKNRWWYIARGNDTRAAGNLDLALKTYQEAVQLFPDYAMTYYEMAWAYHLNEQPEMAQKNIEKALSLIGSPNEQYYVRAGKIYEWAGKKNQALNNYRQALRIDPQNVSALEGVERLDQ